MNEILTNRNFLSSEESEKYKNEVLKFLETVSPSFSRDDPETWEVRDHHTLKDTKVDPIPQSYPISMPYLVSSRGAGWILLGLRELVVDRMTKMFPDFMNVFVDNRICCSIEGFTVVPPQANKEVILSSIHTENHRPCGIRVVLPLSFAAEQNSILTKDNEEVTRDIDTSTGSLVAFHESNDYFRNYQENTPIKYDSFENVLLESYFFSNTHSQCGKRLVEGLDEWKRNVEQSDLSSLGKVRMIKSYQHIRGHKKLKLKQYQMHGILPYNFDEEKQKQFFEDIQSFLLDMGIFYESDQPVVHPQLRLLECEISGHLPGQDKYLGGVDSPCGKYIYGVPGNALRVLRVTVSTGKVDMIGPILQGKFKWLRGVSIPASIMGAEYPSGVCIAIPCNAKSILRINPHTNEVVTFGEDVLNSVEKWSYHGGDLASDGFIYAIPANATRVLKIDPRKMICTFIGPTFIGVQKWYGGLLASNGCIYGIPQNSSGCLKINPKSGDVSIVGEGTLPSGKYMWHGGLTTHDKRYIYGFPNHADRVLKLDTNNDTLSLIGDASILSSGRHRFPQDGKYKYLGGAIMSSGKAFLFPCEAERVLMIDTRNDQIRCVGPYLLEGENKYQNGFCCSNEVYGIPQRARGVLRISLDEKSKEGVRIEVLDCGENIRLYKDKFEGGVLGKDGCIYCMPLICKDVVKIVPTRKETINYKIIT